MRCLENASLHSRTTHTSKHKSDSYCAIDNFLFDNWLIQFTYFWLEITAISTQMILRERARFRQKVIYFSLMC